MRICPQSYYRLICLQMHRCNRLCLEIRCGMIIQKMAYGSGQRGFALCMRGRGMKMKRMMALVLLILLLLPAAGCGSNAEMTQMVTDEITSHTYYMKHEISGNTPLYGYLTINFNADGTMVIEQDFRYLGKNDKGASKTTVYHADYKVDVNSKGEGTITITGTGKDDWLKESLHVFAEDGNVIIRGNINGIHGGGGGEQVLSLTEPSKKTVK